MFFYVPAGFISQNNVGQNVPLQGPKQLRDFFTTIQRKHPLFVLFDLRHVIIIQSNKIGVEVEWMLFGTITILEIKSFNVFHSHYP